MKLARIGGPAEEHAIGRATAGEHAKGDFGRLARILGGEGKLIVDLRSSAV